MSISFKNTKYHTFSPSGTTTKIAEELSVSPLAIFLSQIWRLFGVILMVLYVIKFIAQANFRIATPSA